jgi:hypothetical protein
VHVFNVAVQVANAVPGWSENDDGDWIGLQVMAADEQEAGLIAQQMAMVPFMLGRASWHQQITAIAIEQQEG